MQLQQLQSFCTEVDAFLINRKAEKYDLIFADPPYGAENPESLIPAILPLLKKDGIFVFEYDGKANLKKIPGLFDIRRYGKVHFAFFHQSENS